jgi:AbrB family looped-hinge helix DNA binding protein
VPRSLPCTSGMFHPMQTTLDRSGRVVVPSDVRHRLRLKPGQKLLIRVSEDGLLIELQPVEVTNSMVVLDDGLPALVPDGPFEALGDDEVRAGIETIREERLSRWR